jgi:hypothetical protein
MPSVTTIKSADPEQQLQNFIGKFEPKHQAVIRAVRKALRKRFPTATELTYDNYNFFVIGFGPTERPSHCIVSIAAAANGVGLCFIRGAGLPDPAKMLLQRAPWRDDFSVLATDPALSGLVRKQNRTHNSKRPRPNAEAVSKVGQPFSGSHAILYAWRGNRRSLFNLMPTD